jgi:phosphorylase kinase gamma subunit
MAPEQMGNKKTYSRSVDVFAAGIIMHMLLTGGEHPLYDPILYNAETYKTKLLELYQFEFPSDLSFLTKNLFQRLTHFNLTQRYTAGQALRHPWITRINKTTIPMTFQDEINHIELERKLRTVSILCTNFLSQKIGLMVFLSTVKKMTKQKGDA